MHARLHAHACAYAQIIEKRRNCARAADRPGRPGTEAIFLSLRALILAVYIGSQLLSNRAPACMEGTYPDQKQEYHLEWPYIQEVAT